jgi:hypothetical protein
MNLQPPHSENDSIEPELSASNTNESDHDPPSPVTDESEKELEIANQQLEFAKNLAAASMKMTEVGFEGLNASIHIYVLSSYMEVLLKTLDHFATQNTQISIYEQKLDAIYTKSLLAMFDP